MYQLITLVQTGREKAIKTNTLLNIHTTNKEKRVTFTQVQQNSSELSNKTSPMSEISPILETYEQQLQTFQLSQTFETLDANCNQSLVQSTSYHYEPQPMTTQQRAAMAQATLVNFFGESGTVTSIMNIEFHHLILRL